MIQRYAQFWFFRKGYGNSFSTKFCVWFSKRNISHVVFYQLTNFHCLIAFTYWDIGQYVYSNCLLPRLWRHEFWNQPDLSYEAVFLHDRKVKTKFKYLEKEKSFSGKIKSIFPYFWKAFNGQKLSQTWECPFKLRRFRLELFIL